MTPEEHFGTSSQWSTDQLRRLHLDGRARPMANMPHASDPNKGTCEQGESAWLHENRALQRVLVSVELLRIGTPYTEGEKDSTIGGMYIATTTIPGILLRQTQSDPPLFEVIPAATPKRPRWTVLKTVARRCRNAWRTLAGKNEDSEG